MFVEGTRIPAIALLLAVLVFAGVIAALWRRIRALTAANAAAASPATGLMSKHLAQLAAFLEDALGG